MAGNGIDAMLAHKARVHDDNIYIRGIIQSYTFATFGKVISYSEGRVDVQCGSLKFTNVEVLVLGVNGWGIKPIPAEGDRVLLISSQAPVIDIKEFKATGTMPPYDASGLKAIPITDEEAATQLITVDKDKIEITGDNKITVNADGITVTDANENSISTSSDGISITDANSNTIVMGSDGVKINDKLHIKGGS